MALSRRRMLALAGGGVILAATGGATAFALTRTPHGALAPWTAAGGYTEKRRRALSWAILAPNPHNRQPWIVDLPGEDAIRLFLDPGRLLPQTDPAGRQIVIGLGCFLELMVLAANADGHAVALTLFPDGEAAAMAGTAPVAEAVLTPGGAPDALFAHAAARRSVKEPFDMARPVTAAAIAAVLASVRSARAEGTAEPARVAALRTLCMDAWTVELNTPRTHGESVDLMRMGRAEIEANPDGIDLGGAFLESLMLAGLLTREAVKTPGTTSWQTGIDMYQAIFAATPAFVWLATPGNARPDQIAAGRDWLRLNLAVTGAGLSLHPVSQSLQEFPEMAEHYRAAHEMLAQPGETVQMLGRLGHAEPVAQTPRWRLEAKIRA